MSCTRVTVEATFTYQCSTYGCQKVESVKGSLALNVEEIEINSVPSYVEVFGSKRPLPPGWKAVKSSYYHFCSRECAHLYGFGGWWDDEPNE